MDNTNYTEYESKRAIGEVFDVKNGIYINSKEFFSQPESVIMDYRRLLQEAAKFNSPRFICPHCHQMVTIHGRKYSRGKVSFFAHLYDSDDCEIKTNTGRTIEEINAEKYKLVQESERHIQLKEELFQILIQNSFINNTISKIEIEKHIKSKIPYLNWRKPDIFFQFKNMNIVIEIQLSTTFLSVIVDRDIFYRLNNIFVIWVFNFEENFEYTNLSNLMFKDIYYANKRNVFIIDKASREASNERRELCFTCKWLDENDCWTEGIIVSLTDLTFDSETYKPYYIDADKHYFSKNPKAKNIRKEVEKNRRDFLEQLMNNNYQKSPVYLFNNKEEAIADMKATDGQVIPIQKSGRWGLSYKNTIIVEPQFQTASEVNENGYIYVTRRNQLGLLNKFGEEIIPCEFKKIIPLPYNLFIVFRNKWFIYGNPNYIVNDLYKEEDFKTAIFNENLLRIDIGKKIFLVNKEGLYEEFEYITPFEDGKAYTTPINEMQKGKVYRKILSDGTHTFEYSCGYTSIKYFGSKKWGIIDRNGVSIIPCEYDFIRPLGNSSYFLKRKDLKKDFSYGLIDINNKEIIPYGYKQITKYQDLDLFLVKRKEGEYGEVVGYYSSTGIILPCEFRKAGIIFHNGQVILFAALNHRGYMFYNAIGKELISCQFQGYKNLSYENLLKGDTVVFIAKNKEKHIKLIDDKLIIID